ncbi:MAG: helix-turn-helix domain-containing protein [Ruminococcus sp.]|nr:helix-turn-helix domain-containing protein [Ruminococcus sp.]
MNFADKLKIMRKQAGMSQEALAEKLGVSRQAVTKWETNAGVPEMENIRAICSLFNVTMDELFSNETALVRKNDYLYESKTEYDIDEVKRFDIKLGGVNELYVSGYDGEKLLIRIVSDSLQSLQSDLKIKIDDIRNRIDVDVIRKKALTQAISKQALKAFVQLPNRYLGKVELEVNAETIELSSLDCESIELDAKTHNVIMENVSGTVEINCSLDMNVVCKTLNGEVAINQVSATSRIHVPADAMFTAVSRGIATSISYEENASAAESFSVEASENIIELNGIKSELVVCR